MSAAAAGALFVQGKVKGQKKELNERQFGRVCPHCMERVPQRLFEMHSYLAHPIQSRGM